MGDLHGLRNKLQSDGNRIQRDIVKYTELSQGILQLATIVSDSVKASGRFGHRSTATETAQLAPLAPHAEAFRN